MKVQDNLIWDKHTGDLIGFVDLGATLQKLDEFASYILMFLVRSVINSLKFSLANVSTSNAKYVPMFPLVWKAVRICEENCNLKKVVGVTSDDASSNFGYVSNAFKVYQKYAG